jgi:hypothetical protein
MAQGGGESDGDFKFEISDLNYGNGMKAGPNGGGRNAEAYWRRED